MSKACYREEMNLSILFSAKVFAVVGASQDEAKVGHQILRNLQANKELIIYPINLKPEPILGLATYRNLETTPLPPEIVIIAVPLVAVEDVIDQCLKVRPQAVVLITSGYAETGQEGKKLQAKLERDLTNAHIPLLGPNTMGYICPERNIFASFGPREVSSGPIGVISQSGAILSALFQEYSSGNSGVSFAISLGNRTGINENDALLYALEDEATKEVVIYLESLENPREFLKIAKRGSKVKPIFLLKGGTTDEGSKAAVSHTAALATSQVLLTDLCHQAGIVLVSNFEQLVRASVAVAQSTAEINEIAIITNAGGPAVVLVDELTELGIEKIDLPVDLLGDASPSDYEEAITKSLSSSPLKTVLLVVSEQSVTDIQGICEVIVKKQLEGHQLFVCLVGGDELDKYRQKLTQKGVIVTRFPNEIAETISAMRRARVVLGKTPELVMPLKSNSYPYPESFSDVVELLKQFNLKMPEAMIVRNQDDLAKVKDLKFPLIAKTTNLTVIHKAKVGAVISGVSSIDQAKQALVKLQIFGPEILFQEMVKAGVEVLLGAHQDPFWGWYMAVGLGGSLSDTYDDRAYVFLPATETEFGQTLERTKLAGLLTGIERSKLLGAMERMQKCVMNTKDLKELEINPLFVSEDDIMVADIKRS